MSTRASWLVLAAATVAWLPGAALADIPPDPDSPDANCSKEKQCPTGEFCDYSFMPGQPESEWKHVGAECRTAAAAKGLQRRCRDGGNYSGVELFCPPGATGSWSPPGTKTAPAPESSKPAPAPASEPAKPAPAPASEPPKPATSSCAVGSASAGVGWLVLAFALLRRRRR
ncbi:hypothetical protein [Nannocystis radixulma]|uniref:MYXO-CTERM domain-containing protein n=1 Tax=Nannocystis radixulma TaxID=2995305 RepID=A0ABT5B239_9BACT|nr:hypothetical protein [Nannocystis radixulma]MDC0668157.1 hypothetical protein [Nannocystis radixulma]